MHVANNAFSHTLRQIVLMQAVLVTVTAVVATLLKGENFLWSTLYGGAIVIVSSAFFGWRLGIATQTSDAAPPVVDAAELFKGIVVRFVLVIGLLAAGMGWLKLYPLGILLGLIVAQAGFWFSRSSYGVTRRK